MSEGSAFAQATADEKSQCPKDQPSLRLRLMKKVETEGSAFAKATADEKGGKYEIFTHCTGNPPAD